MQDPPCGFLAVYWRFCKLCSWDCIQYILARAGYNLREMPNAWAAELSTTAGDAAALELTRARAPLPTNPAAGLAALPRPAVCCEEHQAHGAHRPEWCAAKGTTGAVPCKELAAPCRPDAACHSCLTLVHTPATRWSSALRLRPARVQGDGRQLQPPAHLCAQPGSQGRQRQPGRGGACLEGYAAVLLAVRCIRAGGAGLQRHWLEH